MFSGIALAYGDLPVELIGRHGLQGRVHERGGEPEVRFLLRDAARVLPVWYEGRLCVARWGNRRGQSRRLPCTAWARLATVEAGGWLPYAADQVDLPATLALDAGVWFKVRQGVRGVAVRDERGGAVVYPLVESASHYYRVMTGSEWMPVLVGERI